MFLYRVYFFTGLTTLTSLGFCADAQIKTITQTVSTAVENHPSIMGKRAAHEATTHRVDYAKGAYFPTVDLQAGAGYGYTRQKYGTNQLNAGRVDGRFATDRYDPSIRVSQMIFDGFETRHAVEKAENEGTRAEKQINETQEMTAFNASEQFIAVRRFGRLLRLADENIRVHQDILKKVSTLQQAGKVTDSDVQNVEARLHDAQAARQDIQGDYDSAVANFIGVVGQSPGRLEKGVISNQYLPSDLEEALNVGRQINPSLDVAKANIEVAKSDTKISKAGYYPRVDLEIEASRRHNVGGKFGFENDLTALAVVRFNLFNGGRDSAKEREARSKLLEAKYMAQNERRKAEREIRLSWAEMKSSEGQSIALRQSVKSKKRVLDAYLQQFDLGERTFLDILDASHEHFLTKGALITSDATYDLASMRLLAIMGELQKVIQSMT